MFITSRRKNKAVKKGKITRDGQVTEHWYYSVTLARKPCHGTGFLVQVIFMYIISLFCNIRIYSLLIPVWCARRKCYQQAVGSIQDVFPNNSRLESEGCMIGKLLHCECVPQWWGLFHKLLCYQQEIWGPQVWRMIQKKSPASEDSRTSAPGFQQVKPANLFLARLCLLLWREEYVWEAASEAGTETKTFPECQPVGWPCGQK